MLFIVAVLAACGGKKDAPPAAKHDAAPGPTVPPIATPNLGVISLPPWSFPWNSGSKEYDKALAASRAKVKDWAAVRKHAELAIGEDNEHYDAHRLLATALVQLGEPAAAVDQLAMVLAADYYKYAPSLADDADLTAFLATPLGTAVKQLLATIADEYHRRIASGVLLVGRRSSYKWPKAGGGAVPSSSRGELYAYDRETRRYLRITHTDHQVAGFVRSPDGATVTVFGFDKAERGAEPDAPPLISRAWVQTLDATTWTAARKRTVITGPLRELAVGYADAQVVVSTATADGRWGTGAPEVSVMDGGKLTPSTVALPDSAVVFTLEEGVVRHAAEKIQATWAGEPAAAPALQLGGVTIAIPESGAAARSTVAVAPDGAHVAFATAVDPCATATAPSLYVADAKGALTHVITAHSRFDTRWVDATTLAYDDGEGAIRLWDAAAGREAMRIVNKDGIALDVLSVAAAPVCKAGTAAAVDATPDTDEPMPPEESGGPVVTPP